jgi:hypothetical protein
MLFWPKRTVSEDLARDGDSSQYRIDRRLPALLDPTRSHELLRQDDTAEVAPQV